MHCPRLTCQSADLRVGKHYGSQHPKLKASLRGMNVSRRRLICSTCGNSFYSIELEEVDFNRLAAFPSRREIDTNIRKKP